LLSASLQKSAPRVAAIRLRRQQAGFYETTVFVHERAREGIDRAIAEGRFKSRREAMEAVIHAAFVQEERAKKPR
jgi:hypothetical protein